MPILDHNKISIWKHWADRNSHEEIKFPGIYLIAYKEENLDGLNFSWCREIIYIGMTNSKGGLRARLNQFDRTIKGERNLHGGADRVKNIYTDYKYFSKDAYVAILPVQCNPNKLTPEELIKMSDVPKYEYLCWAEYLHRYKELPAFNKRTALKFSKTSQNI